jgi:hypothetical protein
MIRATSGRRPKRLEAERADLQGAAIGRGALDYHAPAAPVSVTPVCGPSANRLMGAAFRGPAVVGPAAAR